MKKLKEWRSRITDVAKIPGMLIKMAPILKEAIELHGDVEIFIRKFNAARSTAQNRLQRQWCNDACEHGDMTAEEYRGYIKLHYGMGILCRDDEDYQAACSSVFGTLTYEQKLAVMQHPIDFPVTRGMNVKQKREFLDKVYEHFTGLGIPLTDPRNLGIDPKTYREIKP